MSIHSDVSLHVMSCCQSGSWLGPLLHQYTPLKIIINKKKAVWIETQHKLYIIYIYMTTVTVVPSIYEVENTLGADWGNKNHISGGIYLHVFYKDLSLKMLQKNNKNTNLFRRCSWILLLRLENSLHIKMATRYI